MELQIIQSKICEVRGQKVMFDFDLAEMYGTETKNLKRSVKSNIKRFPVDFMFEVAKDEWDSLRCSFSTLNGGRGRHPKYMPYVFTDCNDINEDTRMQMESISQALAELQAKKKLEDKPRNPIGFIKQ